MQEEISSRFHISTSAVICLSQKRPNTWENDLKQSTFWASVHFFSNSFQSVLAWFILTILCIREVSYREKRHVDKLARHHRETRYHLGQPLRLVNSVLKRFGYILRGFNACFTNASFRLE